MRPWISYTLWRVGIFAVAFGVLYAALRLPLESLGIAGFAVPAIAALIAALISLTVSYIFLARMREAVAQDVADRRARRHEADADSAEEDALLGEDADPTGEPGTAPRA